MDADERCGRLPTEDMDGTLFWKALNRAMTARRNFHILLLIQRWGAALSKNNSLTIFCYYRDTPGRARSLSGPLQLSFRTVWDSLRWEAWPDTHQHRWRRMVACLRALKPCLTPNLEKQATTLIGILRIETSTWRGGLRF